MIKRIILISQALFLFTAISLADGNESLFELANEKYSEGLYEEAIESYENILSSGYSSAALYYNLGNAYYKQNNVTKAILNYERALLLSPGDEDIKYNLDIANQLVTDKIDALPEFFLIRWIRQVRTSLSPGNWGIFSITGFAMAGIFFLLFYFLRKRALRRLFFILSFLAVFLSGTTLFFGIKQNRELVERNTAIVVSPTVKGKSSPDEGGTDLFVLHEGVKVWITDKLNAWIEIKLADGNKAWVPENSLERI
jgi:tetratricopeptide (TPR) repeat protein